MSNISKIQYGLKGHKNGNFIIKIFFWLIFFSFIEWQGRTDKADSWLGNVPISNPFWLWQLIVIDLNVQVVQRHTSLNV